MTTTNLSPRQDALVLYRQRPARITAVGPKKITVKDDTGRTVDVRVKDVTVLHPGPLRSFADLASVEGDIESAWELMAGETASLAEFAELAYDEFSPASAWSMWQQVVEGVYFHGTPDAVSARTAEEVAAQEAAREAKVAEEAAWTAFRERIDAGTYAPEDEALLSDVVALALEERDESRTMRELDRAETPRDAHALLLTIGYWDASVNPYPRRFNAAEGPPSVVLPDLPDEERRDLTHLTALAIDDEGNQDPDDAISLEEGRLWVHVADVAALVTPGSEADEEACARSANIYLPEGTIPMLPPQATDLLGLGLHEVSPALSFGLDLDDDGKVIGLEIVPSLIHVTRMTYEEAEDLLYDDPLLGALHRLAQAHMGRRLENGAVELTFPEARFRVIDGEIDIRPLPPLQSRILVREAMLMAGEAVARYAIEHEIPMPFSTQAPPNVEDRSELEAETLAEMFAVRRLMNPGRQNMEPSAHSGLGLDAYVQATSPLRRYFDLIAHQQVRAHQRGEPVMDEATVTERLAGARAMIGSVRLSERLSNAHWTLVYLLEHPHWEGQGIVVDQRRARCTVLIPELAYQAEVYVNNEIPLDSEVTLQVADVDLPQLEAKFRVV